jgi:hypothetical protein
VAPLSIAPALGASLLGADGSGSPASLTCGGLPARSAAFAGLVSLALLAGLAGLAALLLDSPPPPPPPPPPPLSPPDAHPQLEALRAFKVNFVAGCAAIQIHSLYTVCTSRMRVNVWVL